jgi:multiple sugar transport system permease protein
MSVSAVGIVWVWILDRNFGLLNYYLKFLGVNPPIAWLTDKDTAMPAIAITTIWWTVNTNMIIYLAGLQDIPEELYEAAKIDGANGWQQVRHITIPMLMPVNAFVIPLTVIASWRVFGQAFVMTQGGPQGRTFTIAQYIYLTAFQNFRMGQAAAAGVVLMLITLFFTVIQLRAMKVL